MIVFMLRHAHYRHVRHVSNWLHTQSSCCPATSTGTSAPALLMLFFGATHTAGCYKAPCLQPRLEISFWLRSCVSRLSEKHVDHVRCLRARIYCVRSIEVLTGAAEEAFSQSTPPLRVPRQSPNKSCLPEGTAASETCF